MYVVEQEMFRLCSFSCEGEHEHKLYSDVSICINSEDTQRKLIKVELREHGHHLCKPQRQYKPQLAAAQASTGAAFLTDTHGPTTSPQGLFGQAWHEGQSGFL